MKRSNPRMRPWLSPFPSCVYMPVLAMRRFSLFRPSNGISPTTKPQEAKFMNIRHGSAPHLYLLFAASSASE